jgi:demethylmenaquinone methyltransferase/2-methoxy-6-polyprenyl-1,4-benzoquinol methylase
MSGGLHRLWKDALVDQLGPAVGRRGFTHIDVAGGTGDIAFRVAGRSGPGALSLVIDVSTSMLLAGGSRREARALGRRIAFVAGDAEALPLADRSVDACTIAFGIRNVTRIPAALAEAARVLKFGGRFLCLEFSRVSVPVLDVAYEIYSDRVIPALGLAMVGDEASYRYLVESIRRFPDQETFAALIAGAGLRRVAWRDLSGGIAAIHSAWRV